MGLHTYKICQVLPRDPDQKMGRPPREVLIGWEGLTDKEVNLMRRVQEPRLRPGQIAELDGKIVARGPMAPGEAGEDAQEADDGDDVASDDTDEAIGDADDTSEADLLEVGPGPDDPVGVTRHATRMLWDAYRRHAAASAELREQTNELNRRAIAQAKELDEALAAMQSRAPAPPPPAPSLPLNVSFEDLVNAVRVGASIFRDVADKPPPKS